MPCEILLLSLQCSQDNGKPLRIGQRLMLILWMGIFFAHYDRKYTVAYT